MSDNTTNINDLKSIEDRTIQLMLREISMEELVTALSDVDDEVKEKIFQNMSQRAIDEAKSKLERLESVESSDVKNVHQKIVSIINEKAE